MGCDCIRKFFRTIADQWSLAVGLGVTVSNFFKPQITVHFPRQTVADLTGYRGHLHLVGKPKDPAKPKCIACMMCVTACPSNCITVLKAKPPKPTPEQEKAMEEAKAKGEKVKKPAAPKEPVKWVYDFSLCSLCGTCADACPVDSIAFSENIYFVVKDRKDLKMDMLAELKARTSGGGKE